MIRPTADNVVLRLLPGDAVSKGGIHIPQQAQKGRRLELVKAEVMAVGPGHYRQVKRKLGDRTYTVDGPFVPTELKVGDVVLIDPLAGHDYQLDVSIPRHNKPEKFDQLGDERGEFRIVREEECQGVVESAPEAAE